jgi:hypothetical protein
VVAGGDKHPERTCALELGTEKLPRVRGDAIVLEQVAAAANRIDPLVDGKVYGAHECIPQGLAPSSRNRLRSPRERRVEMHVGH